MTSQATISDEAAACMRAYEALRSNVLAGTSAGGHAGLVVLVRQGLAAWMARRLACACMAPAEARTASPLVGEEIHGAIVRVLASMALAAQREGRL